MKRKIAMLIILLPLSCTNGVYDMIGDLVQKVPICVRHSAPDGGDGRGWSSAYNNIQDAVNAAEPGDEIWVAGDYSTNTLIHFEGVNSIQLYGGFDGTEKRRAERKNSRSVITSDGSNDVFQINQSLEILVDGFTVQGSAGANRAVLIEINSSAVFRNCLFRNNGSTLDGIIYCADSGIEFINCRFENNTSSSNGGAICCTDSNIEITNTTFTGNKNIAAACFGGAVWCQSSILKITGCTFAGNSTTSGRGGAIYCEVLSNIQINETAFINNIANGTQHGGAIFADSGILMISDSTFDTNSAWSGGAIRSENGNTLKISDTLFKGNSSADNYGGAVYSVNSALVIINSVFNSNHTGETTGSHGGAIYIQGTYDDIIVNSTFFNNNIKTSFYGAIYNLGTTNLYIYNCIFYQNKGTAVGGSGTTFMRNNAWDDGSSCTGSVTLTQSPFVSITSGSEDFRLASGSNCINNGFNNVSIPGLTMPSTDIAGNPRVVNGIDIGAYESQ